jgi:hypothetical protein
MNTKTTLSKGSWIQLNERRAARTGILLLLLLLLLTLPAAVEAQFTYVTNNGTITITGYYGPVGAVTIPDTMNGLPVTSIGHDAFYNRASPGPGILTSVRIPDSVTSIGDYAFAWNYTLRSATLGNGLRSIGAGAFADCGLTTITIPRSVSSIGDIAFNYCALTGVYFLGNAPSLGGPSVFQRSQGYPTVYYLSGTTGWEPTFGGCPTALWFPPLSGYIYTTTNGTITITGYTGPGGAVDIPSTINGLPVTVIGLDAFVGCASLTSVRIPNSVTIIEGGAFNSCISLAGVTIPNGITNIGPSAFRNCPSLTSITIPDSVTSIGSDAFAYCTRLASVTIPDNITDIGDRAFEGCTSLISVTIPSSVTSIGGYAFALCTRLSSMTIPDSVTSIRDHTFYYCSSLTNVTIGSGVTSIADQAFDDCISLTNITIPDSVTTIGNDVFLYCTSLANVTIGKGVTSIGDHTFYYCTSLTAITVDALNPIFCSLDGILFDKSQTALIQCPGRKAGSYTIPDSVSSIGNDAFFECTKLTNVTIGNGVTTIGDHAFYYCTNLIGVAIPNTVTSIRDYAFCGCSSLTNVTIGNGVTSIGEEAFSACSRLTNLTIGNSVTSIGNNAFDYCTRLTGVYFQGNAPSLGGDYVFEGDNHATIYCLPGTSGWGATFGGRPVVRLQGIPPTLQTPPQTQTAEAGSAVSLRVKASGSSPLFCLWYLNYTNLISSSTNRELGLTNLQLAQSGAYTVVVSNVFGAVTSAPAILNVIAAVERRPVPGVKVMGEAGVLLNVDYADSLSPAPTWAMLGSVSLTSTSQYYFDLTLPLPSQRLYRAWQTGAPGVRPSLDLHLVTAITLTGSLGGSVRLDCINQFGPIDAWVTLDTVTLTNASQLYFDTSSIGQPQRLYRLVPLP